MSSPIMVGHMEQRAINQLTEYPQNARTHPGAQIEQIVASIREFGFVNPILIGTDDRIIAGHARLRRTSPIACGGGRPTPAGPTSAARPARCSKRRAAPSARRTCSTSCGRCRASRQVRRS